MAITVTILPIGQASPASAQIVEVRPLDPTAWKTAVMWGHPGGTLAALDLSYVLVALYQTKTVRSPAGNMNWWAPGEFQSVAVPLAQKWQAGMAGINQTATTLMEENLRKAELLAGLIAAVPELGPFVGPAAEYAYKRWVDAPGREIMDGAARLVSIDEQAKAFDKVRGKTDPILDEVIALYGPDFADFEPVWNGLVGHPSGVSLGDVKRNIIQMPEVYLKFPTEVRNAIRPDGSIAISKADLTKAMGDQLKEIKILIDKDQALLKDIKSSQDFVVGWIVNEEIRREKQRQDELQAQEHQLKIQAANASIYLISTLIGFADPKLGRQFSAIGTAAIQTAEAIRAFTTNAAKFTELGLALGSAVLTANLVQVAMSVISVFMDGPTPEQLILQEIGHLRTQVETLRREMHDRFDRIDLSLNTLYITMNSRFAALENQQLITRAQLAEVRTELVHATASLDRLTLNIHGYLLTLGRRELLEAVNAGLNYGGEMPFDPQYRDFENKFHSWATIHASDDLEQPAANRSLEIKDVAEELQKPLETNIMYLDRWLQVNGLGKLTEVPVPNPTTWALAGRSHAELAIYSPANARRHLRERGDRAQSIRQAGERLRLAFARITKDANGQANTRLFSELLSQYNAQMIELDRDLEGVENTYLLTQKSGWRGGLQPSIDIWTNVTETPSSTYDPPTLNTLIPPRTPGQGPSVQAPPGFFRYVTDLVRLTDYFKHPTSPPRLTMNWEAQWVPDLVQLVGNVPTGPYYVVVWAKLSVKIRILYGNTEIQALEYLSPRPPLPNGFQGDPGNIDTWCKRALITFEVVCPPIVWNQAPHDAFSDGWDDQWPRGCEAQSRCLPAIKPFFQAGGQEIHAACGAESCDSHIALQARAEVNQDLLAVRQGVYIAVFNALNQRTIKGARSVDGVKALLHAFTSLGLPRAIDADEQLRSYFAGSEPLVDSGILKATYANAATAASNGTDVASMRPVIAQLAQTRQTGLRDRINQYLALVQSGARNESHPLVEVTMGMLAISHLVAQGPDNPVIPGSQACQPRPSVGVASSQIAPGTLQVGVSVRTNIGTKTNALNRIEIKTVSNATVDIAGGPTGVTGSASFTPPAGAQGATFVVRRANPGPFQVNFDVLDSCGPWPSFVGGGANVR